MNARRVAVGLGANLGPRAATLEAAFRRLAETEGVSQARLSRLYESEPLGFTDQPPFLNAVVLLFTTLERDEFLARLFAIEQEFGRRRERPDGPRTLDCDWLFDEETEVDEAHLTLPHPRLHRRRFVLAPLCELAPNWRHPASGCRASELLAALDDPAWVRLYVAERSEA